MSTHYIKVAAATARHGTDDLSPGCPSVLANALHEVLRRIDNAAASAARPSPRLLAVAKTQPATAIAELAAAFRQAQTLGSFSELGISGALGDPPYPVAVGENYVQETRAKQQALAGSELAMGEIEWHLIGHLQSNKAADAAVMFDWVQSVDRIRLVKALAQHRPADRPALNVLIQVNIDDEAGKHGCRADAVPTLAAGIAAEPSLVLRGLMAIPAPSPDPQQRHDSFRRMRALFDVLAAQYPQADTLSMGMSDDLDLAIQAGSTMVRVGTALFGPRARGSGLGTRDS